MTTRCFRCRKMIKNADAFYSRYSNKPMCEPCHKHVRGVIYCRWGGDRFSHYQHHQAQVLRRRQEAQP